MRSLPPDDGQPVLLACSHGTAAPAGRSTVARLGLATAAARPGLTVRAAFVDVQPPSVASMVRLLAEQRRRCVVVPLLLSTGQHVRVDIGAAVSGGGGWAVAAERLGADAVLAPVLADRLVEAGISASDGDTAVVVAAAGSSDPDALVDAEAVAKALGVNRAGPVLTAYVSPMRTGVPSVAEAVAVARAQGARRVAVATYLLAPGRFSDRLAAAGADIVTAPLGLDVRVVTRVLQSYDAARMTFQEAGA